MHRLNSSVGNFPESYLVHMGVGRWYGVVGLSMSSLLRFSNINSSLILVDSICGVSPRRSGSVDCGEEAMNRILEGVVTKG